MSGRSGLIGDCLKAGAVYIILICAAYSPVIFYGKTLSVAARYPWFENYPHRSDSILPKIFPNTFNVDLAHPAAYEEMLDLFIGNQIKKGVFPLWNPFIACGTTVVEQFSVRALFPYQILQDVFPRQWHDFFLLGRLFLSAMGVFIFLRLLDVSFYPCVFGGLMYGLSGAMTVFLTLTEFSNVGMMLPYTLVGAQLLNRRRGIISVGFCSLAIALLILAGQPEVSFYGLLLFLCYCLFKIITKQEKRFLNNVGNIFFLFTTLILAFAISSPFFIPHMVNSGDLYTLHTSGGTMGIETPTPVANFMAILFPELLRWRYVTFSFTSNAGWDSLGGYLGIIGFLMIIKSFNVRWHGRKEFIFFLCFALFVLFKNLGFPIISWIGRLPFFDQVWTPRWAGPAWNLPLVLASALGFEALALGQRRVSPDSGKGSYILKDKRQNYSWALILSGCLLLSLGLLVNPILIFILKGKCYLISRLYFMHMLLIVRLSLVAAGVFILIRAIRRLNLSWMSIAVPLLMTLCILNFKTLVSNIDSVFLGDVTNSTDKLVLFSMWQGILETIFLVLGAVFVVSFALKRRFADKDKFIFTILGLSAVEMSFHVTIDYDEPARLIWFLSHLLALTLLILFFLFSKRKVTDKDARMGLGVFFILLILSGSLVSKCLPDRRSVFRHFNITNDNNNLSRVMGIKGLNFPNISAAYGIYDINSIVSLSVKRFQLFQDYCLSVVPQAKYFSLWFTGIIDPQTGRSISEHIKDRHRFYSLAGVGNYLSPDYEDIPDTKMVQDGEVKNYQNLAVMPRAFIVHNWFLSGSIQESISWMLSHGDSFSAQAVVENSDMVPPAIIQDKPNASVEIKSYGIHKVILRAETNVPGLLILTDTYYPDWVVTVDGKKDKIVPADLCFRGVFLKPGEHEVEFIYFPRVFYACIAVSLVAVLILLFLSVLKIHSKICGGRVLIMKTGK